MAVQLSIFHGSAKPVLKHDKRVPLEQGYSGIASRQRMAAYHCMQGLCVHTMYSIVSMHMPVVLGVQTRNSTVNVL